MGPIGTGSSGAALAVEGKIPLMEIKGGESEECVIRAERAVRFSRRIVVQVGKGRGLLRMGEGMRIAVTVAFGCKCRWSECWVWCSS